MFVKYRFLTQLGIASALIWTCGTGPVSADGTNRFPTANLVSAQVVALVSATQQITGKTPQPNDLLQLRSVVADIEPSERALYHVTLRASATGATLADTLSREAAGSSAIAKTTLDGDSVEAIGAAYYAWSQMAIGTLGIQNLVSVGITKPIDAPTLIYVSFNYQTPPIQQKPGYFTVGCGGAVQFVVRITDATVTRAKAVC